MQVKNVIPTAPPKETANIGFKPHLKVFKNAIDINVRLCELLGINIADSIMISTALIDGENQPPFLVVYAHPLSSAIVAPSSQRFYHALYLDEPAVQSIINLVAQTYHIPAQQLPYPFYLTTGKKHEIMVPDADSAYPVYKLSFSRGT